jgi:hypothetical protein
MTEDSKQTQDIGLTIRRGNNGANKGMIYSRQPASYDESRLFGEVIMSILDMLRIPIYRHAKSNHVYSYRQKIAVLVFMSAEGLTYNSLHRTLGRYQGFLDAIGMTRSVPNGSTMNKFMKSLDKGILESIFPVFRRYLRKNSIVAIDATGISNFNRSRITRNAATISGICSRRERSRNCPCPPMSRQDSLFRRDPLLKLRMTSSSQMHILMIWS